MLPATAASGSSASSRGAVQAGAEAVAGSPRAARLGVVPQQSRRPVVRGRLAGGGAVVGLEAVDQGVVGRECVLRRRGPLLCRSGRSARRGARRGGRVVAGEPAHDDLGRGREHSRHRSLTRDRLVVPRRSTSTKPVSASSLRWCDTVDWPTSTASTISPTVMGRRAHASRLRISTRDASPSARNQLAHTSARHDRHPSTIDDSR